MEVKVAVVQESPVFFNKAETIEKVASITQTYAQQGCKLLVFPESFIPGYPRGFDFGAVVGRRTQEGRAQFADYYLQSVDLESDDLTRLEAISRENQCYLVIGITERQKNNRSLYCSMLYISPHAGLLGVHRKIKPTGSERIIWGESDASGLITCDTSIGQIGGLICWENYMPLARQAIFQQGVDIYIAPTADSREAWTSTMRHIALEGRCFVLGCNQYFTRDMYSPRYHHLTEAEEENICPGGSVIVSPLGEIIAGPLFNESGVLVADLELEQVTQSRLDFDVAGHYARPDIFGFQVNGQPEQIREKPNRKNE